MWDIYNIGRDSLKMYSKYEEDRPRNWWPSPLWEVIFETEEVVIEQWLGPQTIENPVQWVVSIRRSA